jgi:hypothetical protein
MSYLLFVIRFDDGPVRFLAGKPESRNAGMLKEHRLLKPPSFPASQLQAQETNNE